MPVSQSVLSTYGSRASVRKSEEIAEAARSEGKQTAFLCHSHKDQALAKGVQAWLHEQGWAVYIDWDDAEMPSRPSRVTAQKIQLKIVTLDWFLFLATQNSMTSRWCPWEIGFADGKKGPNKVVVIPTSNEHGTHGSEYMDLYRKVDSTTGGYFELFEPGRTAGGTRLSSISRSF